MKKACSTSRNANGYLVLYENELSAKGYRAVGSLFYQNKKIRNFDVAISETTGIFLISIGTSGRKIKFLDTQ